MNKDPENKLLAALRGFGVSNSLVVDDVSPETSTQNSIQGLRGFRPGGMSMAQIAEVPPKPPEPPTYSAKEMLFRLLEASLYDPILLHGLPYNHQIFELRNQEIQYDRYCPACKRETPWASVVPYGVKQKEKAANWLGQFAMESKCGRCELSAGIYILATKTAESDGKGSTITSLTKFGQWPSLAEFHGNDLGLYKDVTTKEQREDFTRAIQAAASGFAAGACTYLRRVVEGIMDEALAEKREVGVDANWENEYAKAKTAKKMMLLVGYLPSFLLDNKRLYNLLSQGIHTLPDADCQELFPKLRQAIELIFKGRHDLLAQKKHADDIAKFIRESDNPKN